MSLILGEGGELQHYRQTENLKRERQKKEEKQQKREQRKQRFSRSFEQGLRQSYGDGSAFQREDDFEMGM